MCCSAVIERLLVSKPQKDGKPVDLLCHEMFKQLANVDLWKVESAVVEVDSLKAMAVGSG